MARRRSPARPPGCPPIRRGAGGPGPPWKRRENRSPKLRVDDAEGLLEAGPRPRLSISASPWRSLAMVWRRSSRWARARRTAFSCSASCSSARKLTCPRFSRSRSRRVRRASACWTSFGSVPVARAGQGRDGLAGQGANRASRSCARATRASAASDSRLAASIAASEGHAGLAQGGQVGLGASGARRRRRSWRALASSSASWRPRRSRRPRPRSPRRRTARASGEAAGRVRISSRCAWASSARRPTSALASMAAVSLCVHCASSRRMASKRLLRWLASGDEALEGGPELGLALAQVGDPPPRGGQLGAGLLVGGERGEGV